MSRSGPGAVPVARCPPHSDSRETLRPPHGRGLLLLVGPFFGVPGDTEGPGSFLVLVSSLTRPHAAGVSCMDLRHRLWRRAKNT